MTAALLNKLYQAANASDLCLEGAWLKSLVRASTILTEGFHGFAQSIQANARTAFN
jgi:hypothetical protein